MAQGFFMHNPMPVDDFLALLIKEKSQTWSDVNTPVQAYH
jgi:hypothetical protein